MTSLIGDSQMISIATRIATAVPAASVISERLIRLLSIVARPKPSPMIGPISGDTSIAPITTAVELCSRPSVAIIAARMISNRNFLSSRASRATLAKINERSRASSPSTASS